MSPADIMSGLSHWANKATLRVRISPEGGKIHVLVSEALLNMKAGHVCDRHNHQKPLVTYLSPPTSRTKARPPSLPYHHHHLYTTITIPVKEFETAVFENIWIQHTVKNIAHHIKNIFISSDFKRINNRIASHSPLKPITAMHRPVQHCTLSKYIQKTTVSVYRIQELTNHFTQPESTTIMNRLTKASFPRPKYNLHQPDNTSLDSSSGLPEYTTKGCFDSSDDHNSSGSDHDMGSTTNSP